MALRLQSVHNLLCFILVTGQSSISLQEHGDHCSVLISSLLLSTSVLISLGLLSLDSVPRVEFSDMEGDGEGSRSVEMLQKKPEASLLVDTNVRKPGASPGTAGVRSGVMGQHVIQNSSIPTRCHSDSWGGTRDHYKIAVKWLRIMRLLLINLCPRRSPAKICSCYHRLLHI